MGDCTWASLMRMHSLGINGEGNESNRLTHVLMFNGKNCYESGFFVYVCMSMCVCGCV